MFIFLQFIKEITKTKSLNTRLQTITFSGSCHATMNKFHKLGLGLDIADISRILSLHVILCFLDTKKASN